ncbi:MAG TPA: hypothetical protein PLS46_00440 [Microthrixaceae bacterium]|nr:hypothetical protein [Microthrixaceae bacterium]
MTVHDNPQRGFEAVFQNAMTWAYRLVGIAIGIAIAAAVVILLRVRMWWLVGFAGVSMAAGWLADARWLWWVGLVALVAGAHRLIRATIGYGSAILGALMIDIFRGDQALVPLLGPIVFCGAGAVIWAVLRVRRRGGIDSIRRLFSPADAYDVGEYDSELEPHFN